MTIEIVFWAGSGKKRRRKVLCNTRNDGVIFVKLEYTGYNMPFIEVTID